MQVSEWRRIRLQHGWHQITFVPRIMRLMHRTQKAECLQNHFRLLYVFIRAIKGLRACLRCFSSTIPSVLSFSHELAASNRGRRLTE